MASKVLLAIAFAFFVGQSWASGNFLATPKIKVEDLEAELLAELAGGTNNASATSAAAKRLKSLEAALQPMYAALPKEKDGTLSHNVVRYVLQRFFAHQHGWLIRGLDLGKPVPVPTSNSSNASQQEEWAPAYLQSLLEKFTTGRGVGLKELAIFASSLESLIHKEEKGHLLQAYAALMQPTTQGLEPKMAFEVLETYMMIYMLRGNWTVQMANKVEHLMKLFGKKVSHWDDTLEWLKRLLEKKAEVAPSKEGYTLDFEGAQSVASDIGDRFARFNTGECGRLKSDLLAKESAKPGRVRLVDFYKMGLQGAWEFNEKIDFLRDIGTLDESDPSTPLVILPNYVQARSNCLAVSSYYAVCCPNECESLMQQLERSIISSTARPSSISKIVSKLTSATVTAPRTLSKPLMQRLQDIASHHGGEIPLHGRLFAQWMHHAFPRECAYPHAAGSTSALTADEWMLKTGQADSTLTNEELEAEVASDTCRLLPKGVECDGHKGHAPEAAQSEDDQDLPWDTSEELLVTHQASPVERMAGRFSQMRPLHDLMTWCALAFTIYGFCFALKSTEAGKRVSLWAGIPLGAPKAEKGFV